MYATLLKPPQQISNAEFQPANKALEYSPSTCVLDISKPETLGDSLSTKSVGSKEQGTSLGCLASDQQALYQLSSALPSLLLPQFHHEVLLVEIKK